MILIGRNLSPFTRRVAVSLAHQGFQFEREHLATTNDFEEIMEKNPLGRVPTLLLDDGRVMTESSVMLDWADRQVGPENALIPLEGEARTDVMILLGLIMGTVDKIVGAAYELRWRPEGTHYQPWLDRMERQAVNGIKAIDERLGAGPYFTDHLTQADISAAVLYQFIFAMRPNLAPEGAYPNLKALADRLTAEIPAFAETNPNA